MTGTRRALAAGLAWLVVSAGGAVADTVPPYAGQQSRTIKALSEDDVAGLRAGAGMGYAKAAELNGYPGPRHVLDLAQALALSADQASAGQAIFEDMRAQATRLGAELLDREGELDRLFAEERADAPAVARLTLEIGRLEARLRAAHLEAHVRMRAVLDERQVARYMELRGYADDATHGVDRGHGAHGHH